MKKNEELAARLRQSIQGCAIHNHGPIQAWVAIEEASAEGVAQMQEVARIAMEACKKRIADLQMTGVDSGDLRIKKEELTCLFIERLLR
jgi:hypothetical protein